jgi:hypothetical protein
MDAQHQDGGGPPSSAQWSKMINDAVVHLSAFKVLEALFADINTGDKIKACSSISNINLTNGKPNTPFFNKVADLFKEIRKPAVDFVKAYTSFKNVAEKRAKKDREVATAIASLRTRFEKIAYTPPSTTGSYHRYDPMQGSSSGITFNGSADQYDQGVVSAATRTGSWGQVVAFMKSIDKVDVMDAVTDRPTLNNAFEAASSELSRRPSYERATPEMFLQRLDELKDDAEMKEAASFEGANVFASSFAWGNLHGNLGPAMLETFKGLLDALREWKSGAESRSGAATLTSTAAAELARTMSSVSSVLDRSGRLNIALMSSTGKSAGVVNEANALATELQALPAERLSAPARDAAGAGAGAGTAVDDGMAIGYGLGDKGALPAPGRPRGSGSGSGGEASGFLFRRIDPVRVARYLEQATRFGELASTFRQSDISAQR